MTRGTVWISWFRDITSQAFTCAAPLIATHSCHVQCHAHNTLPPWPRWCLGYTNPSLHCHSSVSQFSGTYACLPELWADLVQQAGLQAETPLLSTCEFSGFPGHRVTQIHSNSWPCGSFCTCTLWNSIRFSKCRPGKSILVLKKAQACRVTVSIVLAQHWGWPQLTPAASLRLSSTTVCIKSEIPSP